MDYNVSFLGGNVVVVEQRTSRKIYAASLIITDYASP